VVDYQPAMLDELLAAGEVLWCGHQRLAARDGLVSLHVAATADLTLPLAAPEAAPAADEARTRDAIRAALAGGGGWHLDALATRVAATLDEPVPTGTVLDALWDLVWDGAVTNDGVSVLRARLGQGATTHRVRSAAPRGRSMRPGLDLRPAPRIPAAPDGAGRWALLPPRETDPTVLARAAAAQLLDRHGVLTRAVAGAERLGGRFADVYRVLAALEESGQVRRGYFVEHLGGSQFALPGAVDELRAERPPGHAVVLAATDPANPFGAALAWPAGLASHRPGRTPGALVVVVDGDLAFYLERGGRTALSFTGDRDEAAARRHLAAGAAALVDLVRQARIGRVTLGRLDGSEVLDRAVLASPAAVALVGAGFTTTPRGLRVG
jgi:ATP-dependent Lhr-like helicase